MAGSSGGVKGDGFEQSSDYRCQIPAHMTTDCVHVLPYILNVHRVTCLLGLNSCGISWIVQLENCGKVHAHARISH